MTQTPEQAALLAGLQPIPEWERKRIAALEALSADLPPFPPMQTAHCPADEDVKL